VWLDAANGTCAVTDVPLGPRREGGDPRAIATTPAGARAAILFDDEVRIVDTSRSGRSVAMPRGMSPSTLAFSERADLAVGAQDGAVYVWDAAGRPITGPLSTVTDPVTDLRWEPGALRAISGSSDTTWSLDWSTLCEAASEERARIRSIALDAPEPEP
jgi:hypothetical protein